jgi:hypothetical protein
VVAAVLGSPENSNPDRLPALLFSGRAGSGKRLLAASFATSAKLETQSFLREREGTHAHTTAIARLTPA